MEVWKAWPEAVVMRRATGEPSGWVERPWMRAWPELRATMGEGVRESWRLREGGGADQLRAGRARARALARGRSGVGGSMGCVGGGGSV